MICVKCRRFFRPKENGVTVEEMRPLSSVAKPGETEGWAPYKLWQADLYACPGCGVEVAGGFGAWPIVEHYESDYADVRQAFAPVFLRVSDCGPSHAGPRPGGSARPGVRSYEIVHDDATGSDGIRCLRCNLTSWNPNDVRMRYCGNCCRWHEAPNG